MNKHGNCVLKVGHTSVSLQLPVKNVYHKSLCNNSTKPVDISKCHLLRFSINNSPIYPFQQATLQHWRKDLKSRFNGTWMTQT